MSRKRIHCVFHDDKTPSMVVYGEWAHCFGCNKRVKVDVVDPELREPNVPKIREDLSASLERIASLPLHDVRGLKLPCDADSYYVVWPNAPYYKRRFFDRNRGSKYLCPSGHPKPLYVFTERPGPTCLVIEGEINACSAGHALSELDVTVVSPGGASEFDSYLTYYQKYEKIVLIADADKAGALAIINLKAKLLAAGKHTNIVTHLMEVDANDILVTHGTEALKTYLTEKVLGMCPRL